MENNQYKAYSINPLFTESSKNTQEKIENIPEKEYGGQKGPEPTRYGDWEKGGRVSDF